MAITNFVQPKTKRQVRQFLGLTGYYRKFNPAYTNHSFNLTKATKKEMPDIVQWIDFILSEYMYLKNVLCHIPSLTLLPHSDEFVLLTDASQVCIRAVLSVR